jgi:hypothetical protein
MNHSNLLYVCLLLGCSGGAPFESMAHEPPETGGTNAAITETNSKATGGKDQAGRTGLGAGSSTAGGSSITSATGGQMGTSSGAGGTSPGSGGSGVSQGTGGSGDNATGGATGGNSGFGGTSVASFCVGGHVCGVGATCSVGTAIRCTCVVPGLFECT